MMSLFISKPSVCTETPKLEFTAPVFRRRLSQLTKMVIQVIHDQKEITGCGDIKQFLISSRGEVNRQFDITQQFCDDREILPASFSLSVFNTPVGQAALAMNLKSGYSAVFPSDGNFHDGFLACAASVLSGDEKAVLFVYADEQVCEEYGKALPEKNEPLAFCSVLSSEKLYADSVELNLSEFNGTKPEDFLQLFQGN